MAQQMEMARAKVKLGDDNNNFKWLPLVTPAEGVVLRAVHPGRVTEFVQHHPDLEDRAKRPLRDTRDGNGVDKPGEFERLRRKYNTKPNAEDWIVDKLFPPGSRLPMTFEEVGIPFVEEIRIVPAQSEPDVVQTQADAELRAEVEAVNAEPPLQDGTGSIESGSVEALDPEPAKRGLGRPPKK